MSSSRLKAEVPFSGRPSRRDPQPPCGPRSSLHPMRSEGSIAKTATLERLSPKISPSASSAKACAPTRSTPPTPRRCGRRVRKWWEKPSRCFPLACAANRKAAIARGLFDVKLHVFDAVDEGLELAAAAGVTELAEGLGFDLADTLAGDLEGLAHFFKR